MNGAPVEDDEYYAMECLLVARELYSGHAPCPTLRARLASWCFEPSQPLGVTSGLYVRGVSFVQMRPVRQGPCEKHVCLRQKIARSYKTNFLVPDTTKHPRCQNTGPSLSDKKVI